MNRVYKARYFYYYLSLLIIGVRLACSMLVAQTTLASGNETATPHENVKQATNK